MTGFWTGAIAPGWKSSRVLARGLTRTDIARYAGASGDVNSVHVDERYAIQEGGHPSVIAHGMLTMGLTASFVTSLVGHAQLRRFGGRFLAPVLPGDSLSCTATVRDVSGSGESTEVLLHLRTTKADGSVVFEGEACARNSALATC